VSRPLHPLLPNSEAVRSGDWIFFGGIVAKDGRGNPAFPYDVTAQTAAVVGRLESYLRAAGLSLGHLVRVEVYLPDIRYYDEMNEAYARVMPRPLPPRKVLVSPLTVEGALVEFTAIASRAVPVVLAPPGEPASGTGREDPP